MRLKQRSRVAIVSPASAAKTELVHAGCARLRAFGYEPVIMPHALSRGPIYYAGTKEERVDDLHAAFADASIDGVFCTRGGWGSAELLPLLDAKLVRANPKVFVGYSDHTSLHAWFWNECGLQTYYAPMVAADWSKADGVEERSWRALIEGIDERIAFTSADGLRVLRPGAAEGLLLGGCLSIVVEALGTPWALKIAEPTVLFAEDIGTKPYQWDRYLQHLKFAGRMEHVSGVVFGDMSANVEPSEMELLEAACLHALGDFKGPVAMGLKCGHVDEMNRTLRLGTRVSLSCDGEPSLQFMGE
jgi:muramoyltetrapeptide carboxypeptidase